MLEELEDFFEELTEFIHTSKHVVSGIFILITISTFGRDLAVLLLLLGLIILPSEFWVALAKSR